MKEKNIKKVALAGGVSANSVLRKMLEDEANKNSFEVYLPDLKYCTDNAAMVGCAAYYNFINNKYYNIQDKLDLNAVANLNIED